MVRVVVQGHLKEGKKENLLPLLSELIAAATNQSIIYNSTSPAMGKLT
jgi:hypothetical protein